MDDRTLAINEVLDNGELEHPASIGVAKLVADKGLSALSAGQRTIYEKHIEPLVGPWTCEVCGAELWGHQEYTTQEDEDGHKSKWCARHTNQ